MVSGKGGKVRRGYVSESVGVGGEGSGAQCRTVGKWVPREEWEGPRLSQGR